MSDLINRQDAIDAINRFADTVKADMGWDAIQAQADGVGRILR